MLKKLFPFLVLLVSVLLFTGCIITTRAAVHSTGRDEPPEVVVYGDDPELIIITGTYVYWLDASSNDVFFYGGFWWRPWRNSWYRAEMYAGPWVTIEAGHVPHSVRNLPHDWKNHRDAPRLRWKSVKHNWKSWEQDKHWHKKHWKK